MTSSTLTADDVIGQRHKSGRKVRVDQPCELCRRNKVFRLGIDHCHEHGISRGIICSSCNSALRAADAFMKKSVNQDFRSAILAIPSAISGFPPRTWRNNSYQPSGLGPLTWIDRIHSYRIRCPHCAEQTRKDSKRAISLQFSTALTKTEETWIIGLLSHDIWYY